MRRMGLMLLAALLLAGCAGEPSAPARPDRVPASGEAREAPEELPVWRGETRADGRRCEGRCIGDGDGSAGFAVRILGGGKDAFSQEVTLDGPGRMMPTGAARWEDVNFDGEPDVLVEIGGGRGGGSACAALLWDAEQGAYREERSYAEIYRPVPDPEHRIVWDGWDVSYEYRAAAWEYRDGAFVKTHELTAAHLREADWDGGIVYTEYARFEDGELKEVNRMEVAQRGADWRRPEEYLAAPPVWEGWAWCGFSGFLVAG